jgi:hypothetical protein
MFWWTEKTSHEQHVTMRDITQVAEIAKYVTTHHFDLALTSMFSSLESILLNASSAYPRTRSDIFVQSQVAVYQVTNLRFQ